MVVADWGARAVSGGPGGAAIDPRGAHSEATVNMNSDTLSLVLLS